MIATLDTPNGLRAEQDFSLFGYVTLSHAWDISMPPSYTRHYSWKTSAAEGPFKWRHYFRIQSSHWPWTEPVLSNIQP